VASLFFWTYRQTEHRRLSLPRHIQATHSVGIGQIKRLAVFATVDFSVRSPGPFCVATSLFHDVCAIEPALEVPTTEFPFGIFLIARALTWLLKFDLVMRELWRNDGGRGQEDVLVAAANNAAGFTLSFYSKRFWLGYIWISRTLSSAWLGPHRRARRRCRR